MNLINTITIYYGYLMFALGLMFNAILIYLIKTKTPQELSNFRLLLLNLAISDFVLTIFSLGYMGRIFFIQESLVQIVYGKCKIWLRLGFARSQLILTKVHSSRHKPIQISITTIKSQYFFSIV